MLGKNRLFLATLALAVCLAFSPVVAQAAPARDTLRIAESGGIYSALVEWLWSWWGGGEADGAAPTAPRAVFSEVGCGIDPNGGDSCTTPNPTTVAPRNDAGSSMDPNGATEN